MSILSANSEHDQDFTMAKDIADTLHNHYPGHLWAVNVRSGVATIHALNISSQWGFVLHYANIAHNAGERIKKVLRAGGEILERAHLVRGERRDEVNHILDGVADYKRIGAY